MLIVLLFKFKSVDLICTIFNSELSFQIDELY